MTGKEMPSSSKKPQRRTFSHILWIAFIVAFIVVFALVAMAWLTIQKSDFGPSAGDASTPQQGVEIWQPNGASAAAGQTYSLPPAADMDAASQASEPAQERPAASRRVTPATPAEEEVPIQPVAPQQETEIRPIEVPVKPAPQPQPRQPGGDGGGNPVDSLF